MKVKRMGITEIFRRIWLFSANKITGSESFKRSVCTANQSKSEEKSVQLVRGSFVPK
jgi:hypothetical protein